MPFIKQLKLLFSLLVILSLGFFFYNQYKSYIFKNNPLSQKIQKRIVAKKIQIIKNIKKYYGFYFNPTLTISNKMPHRLYGLSVYSVDKNIEIFLNKKRFFENKDYMIENVLAHEYAHALMFRLQQFSSKNGGHSIEWQKACIVLGGIKCDRFVNYHDILKEKSKLWK